MLHDRKVIVWLGKCSSEPEPAFQLMQDLVNANPQEIGSVYPKYDICRLAFVESMRAQWWSRVWVVQEVSLAETVMIRCGRNEVCWDTMEPCFKHLSTGPNHGLDQKVLQTVNVISELRNSNVHHGRDTLELAIQFRDRVAGKPRHKILGYPGLAHHSPLSFIPDKPYDIDRETLFNTSLAKV